MSIFETKGMCPSASARSNTVRESPSICTTTSRRLTRFGAAAATESADQTVENACASRNRLSEIGS
jgi:hypothetical protein